MTPTSPARLRPLPLLLKAPEDHADYAAHGLLAPTPIDYEFTHRVNLDNEELKKELGGSDGDIQGHDGYVLTPFRYCKAIPSHLMALRIPTANDLQVPLPALHALPAEIRLKICKLVFDITTMKHVRIDLRTHHCDSDSEYLKNSVGFNRVAHRSYPRYSSILKELQGAFALLHPSIVGAEIAAEAAEALYTSKAIVYPDPKMLQEDMRRCVFGCFARPGMMVTTIRINLKENLLVEGDADSISRRHGMRKDDWVLLEDHHKGLSWENRADSHFRQIARYLLRMRSLKAVDFYVDPAASSMTVLHLRPRKKAGLCHYEIRNIIPTVFRLRFRGVKAKVFAITLKSVCDLEQSASIIDIDTRRNMEALLPEPLRPGEKKHALKVNEGKLERKSRLPVAEKIQQEFHHMALTDLIYRLQEDKDLVFVNGDFCRRKMVADKRKRAGVEGGLAVHGDKHMKSD